MKRLSFQILVINLIFLVSAYVSAEEKARNVQSDRYVINQTFDGQSFFKDNNVWIYNAGFADTFGMPTENIDPNLKGVEAAAFRIEDANYKLCGMGGKAENCKQVRRCMLDIYIDERKYPLPWATDQRSDWEARYNSLNWLKTPTEKPTLGSVSEGIHRSIVSYGGLGPFADKESHQEAFFVSDQGSSHRGSISGAVVISGYKKNAVHGFTLISLDNGCIRSPDKDTVAYYLDSRIDLTKEGFIRRFIEFEFPAFFTRKIDDALRIKEKLDNDYYKLLLESIKKH